MGSVHEAPLLALVAGNSERVPNKGVDVRQDDGFGDCVRPGYRLDLADVFAPAVDLEHIGRRLWPRGDPGQCHAQSGDDAAGSRQQPPHALCHALVNLVPVEGSVRSCYRCHEFSPWCITEMASCIAWKSGAVRTCPFIRTVQLPSSCGMQTIVEPCAGLTDGVASGCCPPGTVRVCCAWTTAANSVTGSSRMIFFIRVSRLSLSAPVGIAGHCCSAAIDERRRPAVYWQ